MVLHVRRRRLFNEMGEQKRGVYEEEEKEEEVGGEAVDEVK